MRGAGLRWPPLPSFVEAGLQPGFLDCGSPAAAFSPPKLASALLFKGWRHVGNEEGFFAGGQWLSRIR